MAWVVLVLAGLFEIVWAYAMKQSDGFSRPVPTAIMAVAMLLSFGLLAWAMRVLPLGTAYTIWTGIGAVGAFLVGIALLGEALTPARAVAALLIVSGLVLMKLSAPAYGPGRARAIRSGRTGWRWRRGWTGSRRGGTPFGSDSPAPA